MSVLLSGLNLPHASETKDDFSFTDLTNSPFKGGMHAHTRSEPS